MGISILKTHPYLSFCVGGWLVCLFILDTCSNLKALKRSLATFVSVIAADEIKPLSTSACGWIIILALKLLSGPCRSHFRYNSNENIE